MTRIALVAAGLMALLWALLPLWTSGTPVMVRPQARAATAVAIASVEAPKAVPTPIRFAYVPACMDGSPPCTHWVLVSERGDRWWLPGAADDGSLALSHDGTLAAYPVKDGYVIRNLTTGHFTRVKTKGEKSIGPLFSGTDLAFSLDDRYLAIPRDHLDKDDEVVADPPMIVNAETGAVRVMTGSDGSMSGWTSEGLVLTRAAKDTGTPGHVSSVIYTVRSPAGKLVRRFTMPGNLGQGLAVSPSGRMLATPADGGIALLDTKGARVGSVLPRPPAGWKLAEVARWEGDGALVVRLSGPRGRVSHQVVDLAGGHMRPYGTEGADVADLPMEPAEYAVVLGRAPRQ
ncbi:hypothetical protein ACIBG8_24145 [Nonomuraea sp. NPDC050556]|uniref:hypothetical protein n=1 Tax=Nonomuraea sp. NPDC050556 TaxID=3364369 RepID=UPI00379D6352